MPNFPIGAWIFLTAVILAALGLMGWMVSQGTIPGTDLFVIVSALVTAVVGVVFHNAGATAALATPPAPAPVAPATKAVTPPE